MSQGLAGKGTLRPAANTSPILSSEAWQGRGVIMPRFRPSAEIIQRLDAAVQS